MGQTLTHGVYLPDEGERNCYSGLAANWQILDTSVGTIAAHTAALAGKAPAVHTHVKADITDFPAYGNAAGTICEGNDSRLSDARTPVAHTHGKADITDLFNSANVWSNANTFTRNADESFLLFKNTNINALVPTDTNFHFTDLNFYEVNSKIIGKVRSSGTRSRITTEITARSWSADGTTNEEVKLDLVSDIQNSNKKTTINSNFIPSANNSYDLGSSSYQWNNLYAKKVNTQSVNGINPGALSLPKGYTEEGADKDYINIASVIQTLDGTTYSYTMPDNGWICVRAEQAKQVHVTLYSWYFGQSISHPTGSTLIVSVPFRKNDQITLKVNAVTLQYARFYPMQGNV